MARGQTATRWTVFQDTTPVAVAATAAATPAAKDGDQRRKEYEWQTVTNKRSQRAVAGKTKQATLAKVATAGTSLSVAEPTLLPKEGEGEGYIDSEDIVRL